MNQESQVFLLTFLMTELSTSIEMEVRESFGNLERYFRDITF